MDALSSGSIGKVESVCNLQPALHNESRCRCHPLRASLAVGWIGRGMTKNMEIGCTGLLLLWAALAAVALVVVVGNLLWAGGQQIMAGNGGEVVKGVGAILVVLTLWSLSRFAMRGVVAGLAWLIRPRG